MRNLLRSSALVAVAILLGMLSLPVSRAADKPLTPDDVTLLLIGGASSQKLVDLVKQRGIGFQMTAELANGFRRDGADETVIQALEAASSKASQTETPDASKPSLKRQSAPPSSAAPPATTAPAPVESAPVPAAPVGADGVSPSVSASPGPGPTPVTSPANGQSQSTGSTSASSSSGPVLVRHHAPVVSAPPEGQPVQSASASRSAGTPSASTAKPAGRPDLADPSPERVQQIVQAFAAKETLFKQARDNYTYHQINKVQEVGPDGETTGQFQQDWDILYDDNGARIERVTYAPLDSLKNLQLTEEDYDAFRSIHPFVLTSDELPEYDVQYKGHVQVDEVTAYVFSIRPKVIQKGKQYFQGMAWVDDRDLQIVKSEGKQVPELRPKHGNENLFPRFTTWREQIDGKFWFPTYTLADDTLYFSSGPIHMKEIIRYTDYKQFKSTIRITNVAQVPGSSDSSSQKKSPPKQ